MNLGLPLRRSSGTAGSEVGRSYVTPLNLHLAGLALLVAVVLYLLVQLGVAWSQRGSSGQEALASARTEALAADLQAKPLRGLDAKIAASRDEADRFYSTRLPFGYADVATQLGSLAHRSGVRLSRVQYVQTTPVNGVTELRIDAAVTGEYRPLALFLNSLERNRTFFLVQNIALSGQQSGVVSLRLRLSTYLREPMPSLAAAQAATGAQP